MKSREEARQGKKEINPLWNDEQKTGFAEDFRVVVKNCEVVRGGIEPPTHGFSVHCSTN
jgi:hypothetical protein